MSALPDASPMYVAQTGQGPPAILVHGAFSDYRAWAPQEPALASTHSVLSVSLRGYHPAEAALETASAERHVEDLVEFVGALPEPAVIIGHSRGGRIALEAAARCGARVRKLVLIEPGGVMEPDFLPASTSPGGGGPDIRLEARRLIAAGRPAEGLEAYIDFGHGAGTWRRLPTSFKEMAMDNARTIDMMIADRSVPLSRQRARAAPAQVLLVVGSESPRVFHRTIDVLHRELPSSAIATIAGGDHFLTLLAPQETNRVVTAFLAGL